MSKNYNENVSYIDTKINKNFKETTTKEAFQEKANHLKGLIDPENLYDFNNYCQRVCDILDSAPKEAANDERVNDVINEETENLARQYKLQRVRTYTKKSLMIHDAENDDNFSEAA